MALRLRGERLRAGRRHWRAFLVLGALGNALPFVLTVAGQTRIPGGPASILIATPPLCTMMAARPLTHDEKPSPNRLAAMLLGFPWAVMVVGPGGLLGLGR